MTTQQATLQTAAEDALIALENAIAEAITEKVDGAPRWQAVRDAAYYLRTALAADSQEGGER